MLFLFSIGHVERTKQWKIYNFIGKRTKKRYDRTLVLNKCKEHRMYIILCLDDNYGLAFNHRRQSQDRIVAEDISKTVGEKKLWITDYSRKLFQAVSNLEISENPKEEAKEGEYVFQELETLDTGDKRIEQFIIYRWNRVYPADVSVEIGVEWKLTDTEEFPGFSHEKITKEIYCRE